MTAQDVSDFVAQQWMLHGDDVHDWIVDHAWVLLLIAALLFYRWVRKQKQQGNL